MGIKKRSINSKGQQTDYKHLTATFNTSSPNNPSHLSNLPTNNILKTITLEDCDRSVYEEFNKRFKVGEKFIPVLLLDAELNAMQMQNTENFDFSKGFLNGPYFTMTRSKSLPKFKTSPSAKKVIYTVPKQKANGIVYEDYISESPIAYDLIYDFSFITNFREHTNQFEEQMMYYFRNKRNIIICNNERFSIGSDSQDALSTLEIVNREESEDKTIYILSYTLKLECFTRDMSTMQKRERPNKYTLDISVKDSNEKEIEKDSTIELLADRTTINIEPYPEDLS